MTTDRYARFNPQRPSVVDTTQRVIEQMDYADGESAVCWDLLGRRRDRDEMTGLCEDMGEMDY